MQPVGAISIAMQAEGLPFESQGAAVLPIANEFAPTRQEEPYRGVGSSSSPSSNSSSFSSIPQPESSLRVAAATGPAAAAAGWLAGSSR
ncbi:hypothetical protein D9M68_958620 [compost metagenome]